MTKSENCKRKMKIEENQGFINVFKRATKLLSSNISLILFLFLCFLPLFCFLIFFELSLQTTVSLASQYLSQEVSFWGSDNIPEDHVLSENLIWLLFQTFLLYLFPYSLLDLLTTTTIVSASSIVYTSEEEPVQFGQLVRRTVEICQNRVGGCLITSLYVLLLSASVFFGFFFAATNYFYIISLIEIGDYSHYYYFSNEEDGRGIYGINALTLSAYYGRGHEKRGLWVMLVFLVFALAMRMPCFCFKSSESSSGKGVFYTSFYVGSFQSNLIRK